MAKDRAWQTARLLKSRNPTKSVHVYKVGAAYMYTTETFEQCQAKYKVRISYWEEVNG